MQTTERPPTGPARGTSPVRGVVLVAVAVVLGFFVLRAIDDTGGGPSVSDETAATAGDDATEGTEGETPDATEPAAPEARPPGEVVVLVANASGVSGAAGEQATSIQGGGYQILEPTNAPEALEATQVLPVAGFEAEAAALAAQIGAPPEAVQPMPESPPVELANANVLVLLGTDLAGGG